MSSIIFLTTSRCDSVNLPLDEKMPADSDDLATVLDVDRALARLAAIDPRTAQVVELRYFGGFSVEETAKILEVSAITVIRSWNFTKAWLLRELSQEKNT